MRDSQQATHSSRRLRWESGIVPLAVVYALLSVHGLVNLWTLFQLSRKEVEPNPSCVFDCGGNLANPWDSPWGAIFSALYFVAILGSVGMALGKAVGRALVTAVLAYFVFTELFHVVAFFRSEYEAFVSELISWWYGWVLFAWLALHVWYLFVSDAKKYFVAKEA